MFRFSIRELMLVTLVAGLAAGWFVDRSILSSRLDQFDRRLKPFEEEFRSIVSFREEIGENLKRVHKDEIERRTGLSLTPPEVETPSSSSALPNRVDLPNR